MSDRTSCAIEENAGSQHITITITVLYFAAASTATRITSETVELPLPSQHTEDKDKDGETAERDETAGFPLIALAPFLAKRHANSNLDKVLQTSSWSVDAEMVDDPESVWLKGGEEVAVICPVSGG